MARITTLDPQHATGLAKETLDAVKSKLGMVPNMARVMAHSGAVVSGWASLNGALAGGVLKPRVREEIALAVAQANGCGYCLAAHTAIGKMVGLTAEEELEARRGAAHDPKEAAAIRLALAIVESRGGVSDDDLTAARARGLSDAEIVEVAAHVALNVLTNYVNRLADTPVDFPAVDPRMPGTQAA